MINDTVIHDSFFENEFESPRDNIAYLKGFKSHTTLDTVVILASRSSNLNLLKVLWRLSFDFEQVNSDGKNALHEVLFNLLF